MHQTFVFSTFFMSAKRRSVCLCSDHKLVSHTAEAAGARLLHHSHSHDQTGAHATVGQAPLDSGPRLQRFL
jgi:hypothetical protein